MDFRKALHDPLFCSDTPPPSFSFEDMCRVAMCYRNIGQQLSLIDYYYQNSTTEYFAKTRLTSSVSIDPGQRNVLVL
jgi:hypothetical protein